MASDGGQAREDEDGAVDAEAAEDAGARGAGRPPPPAAPIRAEAGRLRRGCTAVALRTPTARTPLDLLNPVLDLLNPQMINPQMINPQMINP